MDMTRMHNSLFYCCLLTLIILPSSSGLPQTWDVTFRRADSLAAARNLDSARVEMRRALDEARIALGKEDTTVAKIQFRPGDR